MPISNRKASASILTVGCRSMKFDTGVMNHNITATAVNTAALIIAIAGHGTEVKGMGGELNFSGLPGSTIPTAVSTESIENTRSNNTICQITLAKADFLGRRLGVSMMHRAFERLVNLPRRLRQQKHATRDQNHIADRDRDVDAPQVTMEASDFPA